MDQNRFVPVAFIPDEKSFLEEVIGTSRDSLHEARIALWFFWRQPEVQRQFDEAQNNESRLEALRQQARQYVVKKVKAYWWSLKFGKEIPFSSLVPEETEEEERDWLDFFGILAPAPRPEDGYNAAFHWKRYLELKKEILKALARQMLNNLFDGQGRGASTPETDWGILERLAKGWSYKRIAEHYSTSAEKISRRAKELRSLLWEKLSPYWKKGFNGEYAKRAIPAESEPVRKKVKLTPEEAAMSVDSLTSELNEKYRAQLVRPISRVTAWRARQAGEVWLNYHRSFVDEMVENYRRQRIERKMDSEAPATLQELRKFPALQQGVLEILQKRLRNPELPAKYLKVLIGLAEGRPLNQVAQEVGLSPKDSCNVRPRSQQYLKGVVHIPGSVKRIHQEFILECLADGRTENEVFEMRTGKKQGSYKELQNFRYGILKAIQREWGL